MNIKNLLSVGTIITLLVVNSLSAFQGKVSGTLTNTNNESIEFVQIDDTSLSIAEVSLRNTASGEKISFKMPINNLYTSGLELLDFVQHNPFSTNEIINFARQHNMELSSASHALADEL